MTMIFIPFDKSCNGGPWALVETAQNWVMNQVGNYLYPEHLFYMDRERKFHVNLPGNIKSDRDKISYCIPDATEKPLQQVNVREPIVVLAHGSSTKPLIMNNLNGDSKLCPIELVIKLWESGLKETHLELILYCCNGDDDSMGKFAKASSFLLYQKHSCLVVKYFSREVYTYGPPFNDPEMKKNNSRKDFYADAFGSKLASEYCKTVERGQESANMNWLEGKN